MGCSPSRGNKLHGVQGPDSKGKTLLPGTSEDGKFNDGKAASSGSGQTDGEACEKRTIGTKRLDSDIISVPLDKKHSVGDPEAGSTTSQRKERHSKREDEQKPVRTHQKNARSSKPREKRRKAAIEKKVDFPEQLVKAHQAAYGYLNPSVDKYEMLLGLLDNAAQTRIFLQPMTMFMVLKYEMFNQELEKIVVEGERLIKDHGENLAWPSNGCNTKPPPDLLQQLLQYTVQRMCRLGQSVKGIGDTALEEAAGYFSSIVKLLEERLNAKRAVEARLMQLLNRIEVASLSQPGPQDSTLFSEDSGISVESESLAESDRQLHRRESCESTESRRTVTQASKSSTGVSRGFLKCQLNKNIRPSCFESSSDSACYSPTKLFRDTESLVGSASLDDGDEEEDVNDEGNEDEHYEGKLMRCLSSLPEPDHQTTWSIKQTENPQNRELTRRMKDALSERIQFVSSRHPEEKVKPKIPKSNDQQWGEADKSPKMPQSATLQTTMRKSTVRKQHRSRSAESVRSNVEDPALPELERTQIQLSGRLEKMCKVRTEQNEVFKQRKHTHSSHFTSVKNQQKSLSQNTEEKDQKKISKTYKGPIKPTPLSSQPPLARPLSAMHPKGDSVKKLIDTFSQGIEKSKQESVKGLGALKGVRKYGVPVIPGLGSGDKMLSIKYDGYNNPKELPSLENQYDVDLDNLPPPPLEVLMDNSFQNVQGSKTDEKVSSRRRSTIDKTTSMSQKLCTSMQSVAVLPSKGSVRKSSNSISATHNVGLQLSGMAKNSQDSSTPNESSNNEAATFHKQAQKITQKPTAANDNVQQLTHRSIGSSQGDKMIPEAALPSTAIVHRRLPSPPVSKKNKISSSSSGQFIFRKLPTPPPAIQRKLPTTPTTQNATPSCNSVVTHPVKASSSPASPNVERRSRDEASATRVVRNACSVFCPASTSLFEAKGCLIPTPPQAWTSCGSSTLPRPWSERGSPPTSVRGLQSFMRFRRSDRRPSLNYPPRAQIVSIAQSCGSEPAINTQGLDDGLIRDTWNKQLKLRESTRSASNPDLCVVGQAIQSQ